MGAKEAAGKSRNPAAVHTKTQNPVTHGRRGAGRDQEGLPRGRADSVSSLLDGRVEEGRASLAVRSWGEEGRRSPSSCMASLPLR
jgi:hypothetical protein